MISGFLNFETFVAVLIDVGLTSAITLLLVRAFRFRALGAILAGGLAIPIILVLVGWWELFQPNPHHHIDGQGMLFVAAIGFAAIAAPVGLAASTFVLIISGRLNVFPHRPD